MLRHHHRIVPGIVLTFVLAAAAPAAARFDLNPPPSTTVSSAASTSPCSEICSGGIPSHGAVARDQGTRTTITTGGGYVPRHVTAPGGASTSNTKANSGLVLRRSGTPAVVHVVTTNSGFHWGDAGIGAGSAFAATLLLVGGVLGASHLRRRATRRAAQQTV